MQSSFPGFPPPRRFPTGRRPPFPAVGLFLALAAPLGCSGDDGTAADAAGDLTADEASGLAGFGEPCAAGDECASGICFESTCTRSCTRREECPEDGWACGRNADDSICRTTRFSDGAGRYGDSCADTPCDEAAGFRCIRRSADDAYAYCTHDAIAGDGGTVGRAIMAGLEASIARHPPAA